ncbi:hypothetical protein L2E82_50220 [Cichorium intybus]|nr:hypothetical protein L2E82_50220 [Cichorium intybus]
MEPKPIESSMGVIELGSMFNGCLSLVWVYFQVLGSGSRVQEHWGETVIPFSCSLEMNHGDLADDEAAK